MLQHGAERRDALSAKKRPTGELALSAAHKTAKKAAPIPARAPPYHYYYRAACASASLKTTC